MKIKSLFVATLLLAGVVIAPHASGEEGWLVPTFKTLLAEPNEIDLTAANPVVTFTLVVNHPIGIKSATTRLRLFNTIGYELQTELTRTDNPVELNKKEVTFVGKITLPRTMAEGVYNFEADGLTALVSSGRNFPIGSKYVAGKVRDLVDAESALLVRLNGELNFNFQTFVGPNYFSSTTATDSKPRTIGLPEPKWSIGEIYDPNNYFEKRAKDVVLEISTSTPSTCTSDGKKLTLVGIGGCSFKVFTSKTKNYLYKEILLSGQIGPARTRPLVLFDKIPNQTVAVFPKSIVRNDVYTNAGQILQPQSLTPSVCIATPGFIVISAGGTCSIGYQSIATDTNLASDLAIQSFEVTDSNNPVVVPTPTPVATPTPTAKPVVKKTITCIKGAKTIKKTAVSPKCPAGYKLKK
jgi:hypothetical protein